MDTFDLALLERDHTEGTFSRFEIPRLLLTPIRKRLTGALKLVQGTAVRMIGFSNGAPTVAASSLAEERLGALLLARGALDASQITAIDEAMRSQGMQFGAAATSLGFLTKVDLASWLKEQHAYVVTRCVLADGLRATFGPLGKLASARSGLPLLRCIEDGIRQYPPEALEDVQQQLGSTRFFVSPQDVELARELGCTQSLEQLLGQTEGTRTVQELMASSEDDDPAVPVLTLILTRLALPEGSTPADVVSASGASETSFAPAASEPEPAPAASFDTAPDAPAAPASEFKPASSVDELQAMLEASRRPRTPPPAPTPSRASEVDSLLSSLTSPAPASRPAPANPFADFGASTLEPASPLGSPATGLPDLPPARGGSHASALDDLIASPPETSAARPTPGFDFGLDLAPKPAARPAPATGGGVAPGFATSSASVTIPRVITSEAQGTVPIGPGGVPTLPPNSPYAVVPRELLGAVKKPSIVVRAAKGAGLLVLGAVLGVAAVRVLQPALLLPSGVVPAEGMVVADAGRHHAGAAQAGEPAQARAGEAKAATEQAAPSGEGRPAEAAAAETKGGADAKAATEAKAGSDAKSGGEAKAAETKTAEAALAAEAQAEKAQAEKPKHEKPKSKKSSESAAPAETKAAAAPPALANENAAKIAQVRKLLGASDFRGAVVMCTQILTADPRNAQAYRSLGIAYSGLGAKPQACESYRRYLRLAGNPPDKGQIEAILAACN